MSNQNDYKSLNGAKMLGDKTAKYGKKVGRALAAKAIKGMASFAAKKLLAGIGALLVKTSPIWGAVLLICMIVMAMVAIFLPDVTETKASEYSSDAMELGIPPKHLLAFDTVLYENLDMEERNPSDSAYYFIRVFYEKFRPAKERCDAYDMEGQCTSSITIPEEIIEHVEVQGKDDIQDFLKSKNLSTDDLVGSLNSLRSETNVRVMVTNLTVDQAMDQAGFDEDQKEHFYEILEVGLIDEEFPSLGMGVGFGATCSPSGEIDETRWSNAFSSAGVLSSHGGTIKSIAKKQGIDPVVMAAIAFHETAYGTSSAIVNRNNPGGLMNPNGSGLFNFSSLEEGLESLGRTLHNRIIKDGHTTIERLGSVYAPVGAANDPTGLNQHWVPNMNKIVQNLGGLTMNCEASAGFPIGMDGATSETAQIVASAGYRFIGNSTYVFGGGRNQSDIARGWLDCSSFVHWAYKQGGVDLGALHSVSTETLNKMGTRISTSEMKVGDLIFWDTYKKDGHVGIYIGNGKFIGSQSNTGVAIVDLNNPYWRSVFSGHVRRLLP